MRKLPFLNTIIVLKLNLYAYGRFFYGSGLHDGLHFRHGQLLAIAEYDALFALIGTTYGGDGQTTFGLPDFRGRIPVGAGSGPGLSNIVLAQSGGTNEITLTSNNLPAHTHTATATVGTNSSSGNSNNPAAKVVTAAPGNLYGAPAAANGKFGGVSATVAAAGGSQAFDKKMPYLGINFVICLFGIFPSRN